MVATIRVLHVDDEPGFADLTADVLERTADIAVDTANHPKVVPGRLEDDVYDCVVSDHDMPGSTGIELLETVREVYPDLPFILFTGKGSEEIASEAIAAGVSGYLQKESGTQQYELLANRIRTLVERARAKRDLAEREAHFRQAQAVADLGSWEKDICADEIYWSEAVYDIFGIDGDEALIDHEQFLEYVHPADRDAVDEVWAAALEGDEYDIEHRIVTDDGSVRWVRERAEITFGEDGEPINALGVVQDITDRKRKERQLRTSKAQLEALFENSPDMINFHDDAGNIVKPNPTLCERTGYSASELSEMTVPDLDAEADSEAAAAIWEGMAPGESHRLETSYRRRDGSTFPVEVHIRRLEGERDAHFVVISRDRRDRRART